MRFYLFSLFIISTAFASGEEVLAEKTDIRSASNLSSGLGYVV